MKYEIIFKGASYKNRMIEIYLPEYKYSQFAIPSPLGNTYNIWGSTSDKFWENHKELNTTVQSLIEKGHAENVNIARNILFDPKGNKLYINKKGDIIGVELKEAIKDSAGNDVKVLKDGKDRTLLDSWLYNNPEAKEFAKKEFDSGLARDGSRFIAA